MQRLCGKDSQQEMDFSNSLFQLILAKLNSVSSYQLQLRIVAVAILILPRALAGTRGLYLWLEQGVCGLCVMCPLARSHPFLRVTSTEAHF